MADNTIIAISTASFEIISDVVIKLFSAYPLEDFLRASSSFRSLFLLLFPLLELLEVRLLPERVLP